MTEETGTTEAEIIAQRRARLDALRQTGQAFPNDFRRDTLAGAIHRDCDSASDAELERRGWRVALAGRMLNRRVMGKAAFADVQDMSGRIQLYLRREDLPEGVYQEFRGWDIGDIIGAEGTVFRTSKGELSVKVERVRLLTKALRPLPEKYHGLTDAEARHRQRYLDLIMNEETRRVFRIRSQVTAGIRSFLLERGFVEVETPMMQAIPGGAVARPFVTHHNALDLTLYLRVAPELYLKRLVIGGMEKVFELNRSFRNEGLSTRHNPEFTMLEFYQAYADYRDLMDLTDELLRTLTTALFGAPTVTYQGRVFDFSRPARRLTLKQAIVACNPGIAATALDDETGARQVAAELGVAVAPTDSHAKVLVEIFEKTVESKLDEPTFITAYPAETSPLARRNDLDPWYADRFEFFVAGRELANGFSELNDPDDQADRFRAQAAAKASGDEEAMHYDADYIRALEYGLPPTAGEGIGIDRLVMFLTDSPSIRDVILFPHLRPERG
ncbi:MAG: lysine--tRNA ligase [Gammaproteobacteria bacterium]|nr:lysine--tRNA ligase [Gammaproteobacteria bacterium]